MIENNLEVENYNYRRLGHYRRLGQLAMQDQCSGVAAVVVSLNGLL